MRLSYVSLIYSKDSLQNIHWQMQTMEYSTLDPPILNLPRNVYNIFL